MRKALVTGIAGQDGYYLARFLEQRGYNVFGVDQPSVRLAPDLARTLAGYEAIDLAERGKIGAHVAQVRPNEIYHLAAHHFSSQTGENRRGRVAPFLAVNLLALNEILEVIADEVGACRFFYAASAHVFGRPDSSPQNEDTPHRPDTPYAISKSAGIQLCRYYRAVHGLFTSSGILYNHESPRRGDQFVTVQIARAAALASLGRAQPLKLRDLQAVADWGAAEDYVDAMWRTLQAPTGDDFVIATSVARTVMDFARAAFSAVGLSAEDHVFQEPGVEPSARTVLVGDSTKIRERLGWSPVKPFESLAREMVEHQLSLL